jgi:molybdate transport system substrate-binding protein
VITNAPAERQLPRRIIGFSILVLLAVSTTACGFSTTSSPASDGSVTGSLTVSAASSLQGAFTDMKTAFEKANRGVKVTVNFGASSTLAQQIIDGAPIDVFASADEANMTKISDAKLLSDAPTLFATNSLEVIVRKGNPSKIASLSDISEPGLIYVTCATQVPIGKYSAQVLQKAGVTVAPASLEPDVKSIVAKVIAGEADAGIVYATDVIATQGAAEGVVIPTDVNVTADYPIAAVSTSTNRAAAQAWIALVRGIEGQAILKGYGFGSP